MQRHSSKRNSSRRQVNQIYPRLPVEDIEMMDYEETRKWRDIFDKLDHDHDGSVPLRELRGALDSVTPDSFERDYGIPKEVFVEMVWRADVDQNGHLDFGEFLTLVHSHELGLMKPRLHKIFKAATFAVVPRSGRAQVLVDAHEEYKCCPPPLLMPILSLIELGVFVYYAVELGGVSANGPVPFNSPLIYDPYRRYEAWRYLSYMLIHAGWVHISTNILVQLFLGVPLEMVHGWWRLLLVYLAGVIAGSLGTSLTDPGVYLAGASGGVYALLLAHLASLILNWKEMELALMRLLFIVILVAVDVGVAVYYRISEQKTTVGYAAHIAGALAGLLVGVNVLRNLRLEKWETVVRWVGFAIFAILTVVTICINVFWTEHFPPPR